MDSTPIEKEIYNYIAGNLYEPQTTAYVYSEIKDPLDKFILLYVFELGRTQKEAEIATGLCKTTVWKRVKRIKRAIVLAYKDKRLLKNIDNI